MKEYRCVCFYGNSRLRENIIEAENEEIALDIFRRWLTEEGIKKEWITSIFAKELK